MVLYLVSKNSWETWVKDIYTSKYKTIFGAEAYISNLAHEFFAKEENLPFVKTRPKSLPSLIKKVKENSTRTISI